jgi:catechol 2,3-dioxygenase-like lactoylglutathione lyase family enzyme
VAITGAHVIVYTPEADAARAFFRDVAGWRHVDAGHGWLIFALPPAEIAVHPSEGSTQHELYFMCDDIETTVAELRGQGVEFRSDPEDMGYGIQATMVLPGGLAVGLYEPRHETAT